MPETNAEELLKDLPVQAEEIGFRPDEMVFCAKCARMNPPNRLKCMYCGVELEISAKNAAKITPVLRKLESWENGFNLVCLPVGEKIFDQRAQEIGKLVGLEKETLQKIIDAQKPLPIVRCETLKEAVILQNRLQVLGLWSRVVADEALAAEQMPKRLRGLEFRDGKISLILFNNDEIEEIGAEDLALIVSGAIFEKTVEATEARKKGKSEMLNATETASDEGLIDIYTQKNANGFRILTKGFDFSCLGAEKGILARENIKRLAEHLRQVAPNARFVDDYLSVRNLLGEIWEVEERRESQGLRRQRFGKFDLRTISSSNNLRQFTKYSRLQLFVL